MPLCVLLDIDIYPVFLMSIPRCSLDTLMARSGVGLDDAFRVFDQQDSGCISYGLAIDGERCFVKVAQTKSASASLRNAIFFHDSVEHAAIVRPVAIDPQRPALVYPWVNGMVLNHATYAGSDRSALTRLRELPVLDIENAVSVVLDAHCRVTAHGFVAVDFYDGAMLFDFDARKMRLIDLDDYRPGPFTVDGDRMPGSSSYMAPEEWRNGATIDERTTVFALGRMIGHLLESNHGHWRGTSRQSGLVEHATRDSPSDRITSVQALTDHWTDSLSA